jgi:tetratricopeptide (TPR) repeat protein
MNDLERAKAHFNEGLQRFSINDFSGAEQSFRAANGLVPGRVSVLSNLATALLKQGLLAEAEEWARQALSVDASNFEALLCLGGCAEKHGQWDASLEHYRSALALRPGAPEALSNIGIVLTRLERHAEALECLDQAIAASPRLADAWINRGTVLNNMGQSEAALASLEQALQLRPDSIEAWHNRGNALANLARSAEAIQSYDKVLAIAPDHVEAHFNKSLMLLNTWEFAKGWQDYEWRWQSPTSGAHRYPTPLPPWNGAAMSGRLLVWAEQGVGDEILYSSMLAEARAMVGGLIVLIDRRLLPLFQRSFADIEFLPKDLPLAPDIADRQISAGSLAGFLRTGRTSFSSAKEGFLRADSARTRQFRSIFGASSLCGIAWLSKNPRFGDAKSLQLKALLPVLTTPGLQCVDLQYGDTLAERAGLLKNEGALLHHLDDLDTFNDLDGLAALIDACDVVVTTSNLTVHIAGALGKPTHLLVPFSRGKIWYWHARDQQSLWYPSVTLHRQGADGDWTAAIRSLASRLSPA